MAEALRDSAAVDAFYEPLHDGAFRATAHTVGPWSAEMQHLGPPSALLTRELERQAGAGAGQGESAGVLARITIEVLGAVPPGELTVSASVLRPGRTIELLGAELLMNGRAVARASAWRLVGSGTAEVQVGMPPALPPPAEGSVQQNPPSWVPGYLDALEWRWLRGHLAELGPGAAWARPRVAVVAGEEPSPLQRLMAVADSANGVAAPLDIDRWLFLNTDLSVHLFRQPKGEWIGLDAETTIGPDGVGLCSSVVHDERGPVGRTAQILTVRAR